MSKRRTLDSFFGAQAKKARVDSNTAHLGEDKEPIKQDEPAAEPPSSHSTYPFSVPQFPPSIVSGLGFAPSNDPRHINDAPDLNLLYYDHYIPQQIHRQVFNFLRRSLFFYRVQYKIKRGPTETQVNTPRYTTVFGIDETSAFAADGQIIDASTKDPVPKTKYSCAPRPLPACLDALRKLTENTTSEKFNFCLVNYYASGADSISYHADDERFLGADPAIASFSLGAKRDFCMRHKPVPPARMTPEIEKAIDVPRKWELKSGDMLLMRGRTQSRWLHSVPKRKGGESGLGRINITFRRAIVKEGTENYYRYNVGSGDVFKWDEERGKMRNWKPATGTAVLTLI